MSHTVKIKTQIQDAELIERTAQLLDARFLGMGKHKLFDGSYDGIGVHLKQWNYPVVFQANGEAKCDTYGERWGKTSDLDAFSQEYAVQGALREFSRDPAYCDAVITRNQLANGDVELVAVLAGDGGGATQPCEQSF